MIFFILNIQLYTVLVEHPQIPITNTFHIQFSNKNSQPTLKKRLFHIPTQHLALENALTKDEPVSRRIRATNILKLWPFFIHPFFSSLQLKLYLGFQSWFDTWRSEIRR